MSWHDHCVVRELVHLLRTCALGWPSSVRTIWNSRTLPVVQVRKQRRQYPTDGEAPRHVVELFAFARRIHVEDHQRKRPAFLWVRDESVHCAIGGGNVDFLFDHSGGPVARHEKSAQAGADVSSRTVVGVVGRQLGLALRQWFGACELAECRAVEAITQVRVSRLFAEAQGATPCPVSAAVVFGGRPDSADAARQLRALMYEITTL